MSGWLSLTLADGKKVAVETPGETFIDIAKEGYPAKLAFSNQGLLKAEWTPEEPVEAPVEGRAPWAPGEEPIEGGK